MFYDYFVSNLVYRIRIELGMVKLYSRMVAMKSSLELNIIYLLLLVPVSMQKCLWLVDRCRISRKARFQIVSYLIPFQIPLMIPIVNNNSATVKYTIIIVGICALIITGSVMSSVYMSILESNYDEGNEITKYDCGNENYTVRR